MIDLTILSYEQLKTLAHDIQLKASQEQQKLYTALRKVTNELDTRIKVMPQSDKDLEAATLQSVITDLEKTQ